MILHFPAPHVEISICQNVMLFRLSLALSDVTFGYVHYSHCVGRACSSGLGDTSRNNTGRTQEEIKIIKDFSTPV